MSNTFLFLGSGSSTGVPLITCSCSVCSSDSPYNKRLRPSGLVTIGDKRLLIDVGPDFRTQALRYHLNNIDGVLLTHTHFDHVAGLDELRIYYVLHGKTLPVLVSEESLAALKKRYDYFFEEKSWGKSLAAQLDFQLLEAERGSRAFLDIPVQYMTYGQGGMGVNGYRFGAFAYISDIHDYEESIFSDLAGVEILVLGAMEHRPSPMHLTIEEGIAFARRVGAKQTYFTHLNHRIEHHETNAALPAGFALSYDGQIVEWS